MKKALALPVLALASSPAFAALDPTAIVTEITSNLGALVAIGVAVLGLVYAVRVFSWGRKV